MYALVSLWQLPNVPWDELLPQVDQEIVTFARQAPGVVAGYWTYERTTSKSVGFILLETAEQAHDLKSAIESHMERQDHPGIQLEMVRVQEIVNQLSAPGIVTLRA